MPRERFFIRPLEPECIAWRDCPESEERRLLERGYVRVDETALEVHKRAYGGNND